jgi:spore coat polysaccharide biosynthesis predicted glycosyltransferase SpsG
MRIGLRADGSETIGAGHVVRQLSIAQFLIRQEADVFLIGDLKGPQWLKNLVKKQKRLNFVPVANADFRPESIKKLQLNSLLIDSYHLSQIELSKLEGCVEKVGVMLDGPQQELSGSIAFAPAFDRKAEWFAHARKRFAHFYGGPEYFVIREEVAELKLDCHGVFGQWALLK